MNTDLLFIDPKDLKRTKQKKHYSSECLITTLKGLYKVNLATMNLSSQSRGGSKAKP